MSSSVPAASKRADAEVNLDFVALDGRSRDGQVGNASCEDNDMELRRSAMFMLCLYAILHNLYNTERQLDLWCTPS